MLGGLLEGIVTAPLKDSSLQKRVGRVQRSIYTLTEEDFPDDLKEDWRKLKAADQHPIDPRNMWLIKLRDETEARAMSLTRKRLKRSSGRMSASLLGSLRRSARLEGAFDVVVKDW